MKSKSPRLALRAIILQDARLLLVNAYPASHGSDLWCAPGGGMEPGQSIPANLQREVHEETGLRISVGQLALVNEFYNPANGFHQVDLYFRCQIAGGTLDRDWRDPAAVVTERQYFSRQDLSAIRLKPDSLADVAFDGIGPVFYDPLEPIIR